MRKSKSDNTPKVEAAVTKTVDTKMSLRLSNSDLIKILREYGFDVPDNARVTFTVLSGQYYAGDILDVDKGNPINVEWNGQQIVEREAHYVNANRTTRT